MWRLSCVALLCACTTPSDIGGRYYLQCDGVDAGWLEITADHEVLLPVSDGTITDPHVTEDGDAWQVDVSTRILPGEGGFIAERRQLKLDHMGGAGTSSLSSTSQPTPMTKCASLLATRNPAL